MSDAPKNEAEIKEELGQGFAPDSELLSNLGKIALTPVNIRAVFIMLTRIHYSDPDHYGSLKPKLSPFIWSKDKKIRTLHIDYDYNFDPQNLDLRPAIFIGTSDIDYRKVAVDNAHSQSEDKASEMYAKIASTNVILRHIGKTPDESFALGDLTAQFYLGMRKMLQERLKVSAFDVVRLMSSKPFERQSQQADQQFIVDLVLNLQYNAAWLVIREGHRLKTVSYAQSLADFSLTG